MMLLENGNHHTKSTILVHMLDLSLIVCLAWWTVAAVRQPYYYMHDDALFYLQIAWSLASGAGITFADGIATNGFHPLWLLVCTVFASLADTRDGLATLVAWGSVALCVSTAALFRFGFTGVFVSGAVLIGLLFAIPYFLFAGFGMETSIACLLYVCFVLASIRFIEKQESVWLLIVSMLAGLVVFARLDLAIVVGSIALLVGACFLYHEQDVYHVIRVLTLAVVLGATPVIGWLVFNSLQFGDPVPISGKLKLIATDGAHLVHMTGMNKLHLMAVITAVIVLPFVGRKPGHIVVLAACIGQFLYVTYLSLSGQVEVYAWYFVPLSVTAGMAVAATLDAIFIRFKDTLCRFGEGKTAIALTLAVGAIGIGAVLLAARYISRDGISIAEYRGPSSLQVKADELGIERVVAFDRPGQLAYIDGLSVIAADGLTTNIAFQQQLLEHGVEWLIDEYEIEAFVGPRFGAVWDEEFCGNIYLNSTKYNCAKNGGFESVEFFSRLNGEKIGAIDLSLTTQLDFWPHRDLAVYVLPNK